MRGKCEQTEHVSQIRTMRLECVLRFPKVDEVLTPGVVKRTRQEEMC